MCPLKKLRYLISVVGMKQQSYTHKKTGHGRFNIFRIMILVRKCNLYIQYTYDFKVLLLPVTGKVASFCPVPTKSELKKSEASFFKGQKGATFQLRSPPAGEANAMSLKLSSEYRRAIAH
jgi:hypothetical protein